MRILLAIDGSEYSDAAVAQVAAMPWPEATEIDVLSVYEPPALPATESWVLPQNYYDEMEKASQMQASEAVGKAVALLGEGQTQVRVNSEVTRGYPSDVILDRAQRWESDLIVVGSHGYSGLKRFLVGSVSQNVSSHAKCSVEIVRRKEIAGH